MTPHFERMNRTVERRRFNGGHTGHGHQIQPMQDEPGLLARIFGKAK